MDVSLILDILKLGAGPAVAAVTLIWLKSVIDDRDFWRDKYLDLRAERDEENKQRIVEQDNTIEILQKMMD